jgi:hypothetical protein
VHVDFDAVLRVDDEPLERFPMRLGQCKRFDLISPKSKAAFWPRVFPGFHRRERNVNRTTHMTASLSGPAGFALHARAV